MQKSQNIIQGSSNLRTKDKKETSPPKEKQNLAYVVIFVFLLAIIVALVVLTKNSSVKNADQKDIFIEKLQKFKHKKHKKNTN